MGNLSSGVLPAEVVAKVGNQIKELDSPIKALKEAVPPKELYCPADKDMVAIFEKST